MRNKEKFINNVAKQFTDTFRNYCSEDMRSIYRPTPALEVPELTDENIKDTIKEYFKKSTLSEAENYMYEFLDKYVENTRDRIDWDNGMSHDERMVNDPMYIKWVRYRDIMGVLYDVRRSLNMSYKWVEVHGKTHTDEEAAKIAADKWCELIFGWHLQDNGAINEDHPGGFQACALGTILADRAKESITEEMKVNSYNLFYEYYLHYIKWMNSGNKSHIDWLEKTLPDVVREKPWDWKRYGFIDQLYCDYGPDMGLFLILYHAGVPEDSIRNVCPWKTGISIRQEDNAVFYHTYQHRDEIGV